MKLPRLIFLIPLAAAVAAAGPVVYTPVVSLGPNPYGPGYSAYVSSAIASLESDTTGGQPWQNSVTTPSRNDILVTDYPSWLGNVTDPAAGGPFGTALFVGVHIVDTTGTFALADLYVHQYSSDPLDYFEYSVRYNDAESGFYAPDRIGIWYGPDGVQGTADDVIYDNGEPGTLPVNELVYVGLSAGYPATPANGYSDDQAGPDQAMADFGSLGSYTITTTYSVGASSDVPEPATAAIAAAALFGFCLLRRKA